MYSLVSTGKNQTQLCANEHTNSSLALKLSASQITHAAILMNDNTTSCAICRKPLATENPATDHRGLPVHEKCYALILKAKGFQGNGSQVVRCPYCVEDRNFKLMNARADGEWFLCPTCGHATMPGHSTYRCNCSKCIELA
jgi:hypothetical protein